MAENTSKTKAKIIIDTDPGVDDIMALLLALKSTSVDITSILLTHGNTSLSNVQRNLCSLFHILTLQHQYELKSNPNAKDRFLNSIPRVAIGDESPLKGDGFKAEDVHGNDGIGNLTNTHPHFIDHEWENRFKRELKFEKESEEVARFSLSEYNAVDELLFQLKNNPPFTITIITLGPLTNLAKAIQKDPYTVGLAKEIYTMGGACKVPGNVTEFAEFNFYADAYAAKIVMDATKGFDYDTHQRYIETKVYTKNEPLPLFLTLIPLDITMSSYLLAKLLDERLEPHQEKPLAQFFKTMLGPIIKWSLEFEKVDGVALHDPLCMGIALGLVHPNMAFEDVKIEFENSLGKCILSMDPINSYSKNSNCVRVCYSFDKNEAFQNILLDGIFDY